MKTTPKKEEAKGNFFLRNNQKAIHENKKKRVDE